MPSGDGRGDMSSNDNNTMCCKPTGVGAGGIFSISPQKNSVGGSRRISYAQGGKENPDSPNSKPASKNKKKGMYLLGIYLHFILFKSLPTLKHS